LDGFAEVLYSKLGQRAGAWVVPCAVPELDVGGRKWEAGEREKAMGYRQNGKGETENVGEYVTRVAGLMRVYFAILRTPVVKPLHRMFQLPRYWIWFARIMAQVGLLETAIAPQLIYGEWFRTDT
jgi:nucleoporin GLE1